MNHKTRTFTNNRFLTAGLPVLLLLVLFFLSATTQTSVAQQLNNGQDQKNSTAVPAVTKTQVAPEKNIAEKPALTTSETQLPYYNYKGISDLEAAKEAWINENPEAYKMHLQKQSGTTPSKPDQKEQ